ncbi:transducin/WD40 repeat-like superfamily protein [Actinidia rufa]|uniref:Transducin/WD40 repeat-like superfamily protein n=1 Tax=Actinidia rufa TaxID=165716 RepID=A0A7J0F7D5_9ERIC|nr:transducin/WD40 repeat-like superfamily protein [Actinidia rufa]
MKQRSSSNRGAADSREEIYGGEEDKGKKERREPAAVDCTIRSCDFDSEQTCVLHSPEKRTEHISVDTEVHLALTPLQPIVFFGFHRRMTVTGNDGVGGKCGGSRQLNCGLGMVTSGLLIIVLLMGSLVVACCGAPSPSLRKHKQVELGPFVSWLLSLAEPELDKEWLFLN